MAATEKYFIHHIVNADGIRTDAEIIVHNGIISEIKDNSEDVCPSTPFYYAIPGFIDIHTHGGDGLDIMDATADAISGIARYHLKNGTTSFIGSTLSAPLDKIESLLAIGQACLSQNRERSRKGEEARLLGFHLEGPWLSTRNKGAHNPSFIKKPSLESIQLIEKYADIIRMVTFDYADSSNDPFLSCLTDHHIIPACGHDNTLDSDILEGFRKGINHVTHLYSCTSTFQKKDGRKHLGTSEMALMTKGVTVEVIADNHHITQQFWDFILHNKSVNDIILVSDSIRAAGLPERPGYRYLLGDVEIVIEDGVAWVPDKTVFAGSIASMYSMFCTLVQKWGVSVPDAVRMTSFNQAEKTGLSEHIGRISPGQDADMVFLDRDLSIQKVLKYGNEVSSEC